MDLVRLTGFEPGSPFAPSAGLDLQFFDGAVDPAGGFRVDASSFGPGGVGARHHFAPAILEANGVLATGPGTWNLEVGLSTLPLVIEVVSARATAAAALGPGDSGLVLAGGLMGGYLTGAGLEHMLLRWLDACDGPNPPAFCGTLLGILPPGSCLPGACEAGIQLMQAFLGGFEATVEPDGTARACNPNVPDDCNAIGICLQFDAEPATVNGLTDAP